MPKNRSRASFAASIRELADLGSRVDLSVADSPDEHVDLEIQQVGGIHESMIFELPSGLSGYMLDLAITNQASRRIYCVDLELRLPWDDSYFDWLRDPSETKHPEVYCFPGRGSLELPRAEVINHVLLSQRGLEQKRPVRGFLLATGGPMPNSLRHGQWIDATLAIEGADHVEYTEAIRLWTDRPEVKPNRAMRKVDVYGNPIGYDIASVAARGGAPAVSPGSESEKSARGR
jgi:hypothetical protein